MKSEAEIQNRRLPPEYWMIAGIALSASGHFHTFAAIVVVYVILRRVRRDTETSLIMVASGFWGSAFVEVFKIAAWGKSPSLLWEQIIVTLLATVLLLTRHRAAAICLLIYCVIGALAFVLSLSSSEQSPGIQRFAIARAILYALGAWLVACWLRPQQVQGDPASQGHSLRRSFVMTVAYWAWFGVVCWFSFQFFWPMRLVNWIGKKEVKEWIGGTGIPPMIGAIGTVVIWLGVTCLLLLLPIWAVKRRRRYVARVA